MTTTHRVSTAVLALALGTSSAPASARQTDANANGSEVPAAAVSAQAPLQATEASGSPSPPPTIVRVIVRNSGFDWGDAGIGAAGGVAISLIGLGGTLAASQQRTRHGRGKAYQLRAAAPITTVRPADPAPQHRDTTNSS